MTLKAYQDKLNNRTFSIGIAKKTPDSSVNLSFVYAPEVDHKNISIVNESAIAKADSTSSGLYNANSEGLLESKSGVSGLPDQNVLVTDEFTTKILPNDEPQPLFYVATLSGRIKAITPNKDILKQSIPYQYGYELQTLDQLKARNLSTDKSDITPLINVIDIKTTEGNDVTSGFKVRLIKDETVAPDAYIIKIYNNFDNESTYRVTYKSYDGSMITEVLKSDVLFSRVSKSDVEAASFMENIFAIEPNGQGFDAYAPTQLYKVTDSNRKPFEFRYRVLANIDANFSKSTPGEIKIGVVYLNNNISEDTKGIVTSLVHEIGNTLPDYISFVNPHPPVEFWKNPSTMENKMEYFGSQEYWSVNLSAPQHYINDYDLIIFTGYGYHDLSAYNSLLNNYLLDGGKILIDNLSNDGIGLLRIEFGNNNPIIEYDFLLDELDNPVISGEPKELIGTGKYINRYYSLSSANPSKMAYFDASNIQVGPELVMNSYEDTSTWTDVVRYDSGKKSIGYKTYKNRGKIFLSNSGLMRAFCQNPNDEIKKFITNIVITLTEDRWIPTPWTYDRVYHIDQLYSDELVSTGYIYDISTTNKTIAKKIIANRVKSIVSTFSDSSNFDGVYHIEAQEYKDKVGSTYKEWQVLTSVYIPATLGPDEPLYAYAINPNGSSFSINDLIGYSKSSIAIYNEEVDFKVTIRPYTYIWRNVGGNIVQEKLYGIGETMDYTISRQDGLKNLGFFSSVIPALPGGQEWTDRNNIFFEVTIGYFDNGRFNNDEQRVNLRIYDKMTGQYKYTSDGDNVISFNDLYDMRTITRTNGSTVLRRASEDIILQAATNYYILTANKRTFSIVQLDSSVLDIKMPNSLNTNENWHPRIKNINFTKTSFDKEDYDRISRTIGFKFEKDYILEKIKEFYGSDPSDDTVASIIAKLDGDGGSLTQEDSQVIDEAFDMVGNDMSYEYNMVEYHKQAWNPAEPVKRAKDELAKYINRNTIQVQYPKIRMADGLVTREQLERVSPLIYKSNNLNWLQTSELRIETPDSNEIGGWRTIEPSEYAVDFTNGIVTMSEELDNMYATYKYSTVRIYKKVYANSFIAMEELDQVDKFYYDISNDAILSSPAPIVYFQTDQDDPIVVSPIEYQIDYERGYLKLEHETTAKVFMSYSYSQIEVLSIKDYDRERGIIELNELVTFNDNIFATYLYEDDYYEYRGYLDGNKFVYLDINPTRGHVSTVMKVNADSIEYADVPTYELLDKTVYFYIVPWKIYKDGAITKENQITIRHTFDKSYLSLLQLAHPEIIIIGSLKISNDYTVYDIQALDTRVRGGGLKEGISKDTIKKVDELSLNFWDISEFEGQKYYANGITVVKLPKEVLDKFTESEVQQIVNKHLALGVLPIISYY